MARSGRVQDVWDSPGYVVRKPLGATGDANALPYEPWPPVALRHASRARTRRLVRAIGYGRILRCMQGLGCSARCWAWKFGRNFRAFEFGAHDYGIGDAKGLYNDAKGFYNVKVNHPPSASGLDG